MHHLTNLCGAIFAFFQLSSVLFMALKLKSNITDEKKSSLSRLIARKLLLLLPKLGPAFVKLGQAAATRADLIGVEMSEELQILQDRLSPCPFNELLPIIKLHIGEGVLSIEPEAVAAASIAVVYKATTKEGEQVALKVLRPGIEKKFRRNLAVLNYVAQILNCIPSLKRLRLTEVVDSVKKTTLVELDLRMEAASADKLRLNLSADSDVYIPKVFWQYTSQNILVVEWIEGIPLHDKEALINQGFNLSSIAQKLAITFFNQAYRDGFFHADIHQGNVMVNSKAQIVFVDFGIMGQLAYLDKIFIAEILKSFLDRDYERVAALHFEARYVPEDQSEHLFALACRSIGEPIFNKPIEEISISQLLKKLFVITSQFQMKTQPQLLLLQKTMLTVEGLSGYLAPKTNMWLLVAPWMKNWAKDNLGAKAVFLKKLDYCKKLLRDFEKKLKS